MKLLMVLISLFYLIEEYLLRWHQYQFYLLHLMYTITLKDTKKGLHSALLSNQLNQESPTTLHCFLVMVQAQSILIW